MNSIKSAKDEDASVQNHRTDAFHDHERPDETGADTVAPSIDARRLADLRARDDGHAFDSKTGKSYLLNPTGLRALQMLQEGESVSSAAMRLAFMYKLHTSIAEAAMRAFVESLARRLA